jgi:hypothetical protein
LEGQRGTLGDELLELAAAPLRTRLLRAAARRSSAPTNDRALCLFFRARILSEPRLTSNPPIAHTERRS